MNNTIKAVYVQPGKESREIEFEHTLKEMQALVGGTIQAVYPFSDRVALICNDEGKFLPSCHLNRFVFYEDGEPYDIICGSFFIVGLGEENFCSLPEDLLKKYMKMFSHPTVFVLDASKGKIFTYTDDEFVKALAEPKESIQNYFTDDYHECLKQKLFR